MTSLLVVLNVYCESIELKITVPKIKQKIMGKSCYGGRNPAYDFEIIKFDVEITYKIFHES